MTTENYRSIEEISKDEILEKAKKLSRTKKNVFSTITIEKTTANTADLLEYKKRWDEFDKKTFPFLGKLNRMLGVKSMWEGRADAGVSGIEMLEDSLIVYTRSVSAPPLQGVKFASEVLNTKITIDYTSKYNTACNIYINGRDLGPIVKVATTATDYFNDGYQPTDTFNEYY